ncbi:MAG TPA: helix-turn-helix domain-containing protein [Xanthobacteraceae bacterium]
MTITSRLDERIQYRNQAAQRVLAVLSAFVGRDAVYGASELSRRLGMNKNMVHRALTTRMTTSVRLAKRGTRRTAARGA